MKIFIASCLTIIGCIAVACNASKLPTNIPACIKADIEANKKNPSFISIDEYEFQGKTVYLITPDKSVLPDAASEVKTLDCTQLCVTGGYSVYPNVMLCNGESFQEKAVLKRKIWSAAK